ncbi:hypothetical protein P879_08427 [Paragonimus westermani]|uniref:Glucosidase 2 subunit beta n=1 Tax=Paragonimus westermani TaxID=34504 RepID=A0A8T0D432_9TREM|nr:hypothetical protein P879_08427 [Paragonimus westermani]
MLRSMLVMLLLMCLPSVHFCLELPRGVSLPKSAFYQLGKPFNCLDGSIVLPPHKINDNYCDCADGSDEPGTPACNNGVFHCRDVQYKSVSLRSAFVNDGICDCCDGSDEYDGKTTCESTCGILAAAVQQARSIKRNEIEQGHRLFKEYVEKLKIRKQEELIAEEKAARERELHEADLLQVPASESQSEVDTGTSVEKQTGKESSASSTFVNDETPDEVGHDQQGVEPDAHEEYSEHGDEHLDEKPELPPTPVHPPPAPKPIDYGPSEAFRMLSDLEDCLEFSDQQYTYRFCAFKEIFQRERGSSGQETSLGRWDDWAYADDDMGRENKYAVMLFKDGLGCWNGPARSTKVFVYCGGANEISAVNEPSRCEYEMYLRTPAACFDEPDLIFKRLHPDE